MAEVEHALVTHRADGGVCRLVVVLETTQTEPIPEGGDSPLVVRIRLENSTARPAVATWMHANGQTVTGQVAPGENSESNIAPSRRVPLYRLTSALSMGTS
jgi:hypothetical protein